MALLDDSTSSPDRDAFMALDHATRAELMLRTYHGFKTLREHPIKSRAYDKPVEALTWLAYECKEHGLNVLAKEIERPTDRFRTIANNTQYYARPAWQSRLEIKLNRAFRDMEKWDEQALFAPLKSITDSHERYMIDQKLNYNTDLTLPDAYRRFMYVVANKGLRLRDFGDRDLQAIVEKTQALFYDMAVRNPQELAHWYLAAETNDYHPPKAWQTLYKAMDFQSKSFPYQLVKSLLSYTPETGIVIEQNVGKVMIDLRHLVQNNPAPGRLSRD